jgi:hypothetical protein
MFYAHTESKNPCSFALNPEPSRIAAIQEDSEMPPPRPLKFPAAHRQQTDKMFQNQAFCREKRPSIILGSEVASGLPFPYSGKI